MDTTAGLGRLRERAGPGRLPHRGWPPDPLGRGRALGQPGLADPGRARRAAGLRRPRRRRPAAPGRDRRVPQPLRRARRPRRRLHQRLDHRPGGGLPSGHRHTGGELPLVAGPLRRPGGDRDGAIDNAPQGGVLFHCAAGKDRTGLISALLLALVDVPDRAVAADYALTAECLRPRDQAWLENGPGERADREALLVRYAPTAEVMQQVLDRLRQRYGGVEAYLRQAGVAADDLARLGARLLAPAR